LQPQHGEFRGENGDFIGENGDWVREKLGFHGDFMEFEEGIEHVLEGTWGICMWISK